MGVETCAGPGGTGAASAAPTNILRAALGACERAQRSASDGTPVTGARLDAVHSVTVARAHSPHRSANKRQMSAEAGRTEPRPKGSVDCVRPLGRGGPEGGLCGTAIARATTQKSERADKGFSQRDAGPIGCGHLACSARACRLWLVEAQRGGRVAAWRAWSCQPNYRRTCPPYPAHTNAPQTRAAATEVAKHLAVSARVCC